MVSASSTRRQIIGVGLLSTLPLVSGCSAPLSGESTTELGQITVGNSDKMAHTIHVIVQRDSELIHGSSHDLKAVSAPKDEDDFGSIDSTIIDEKEWDGTTGDWSIYTRVDDQTSWDEHKIPADNETECHTVRLKIEDDSSVTSFTPDCASWPPSTDT